MLMKTCGAKHVLMGVCLWFIAVQANAGEGRPEVAIETRHGQIVIELLPEIAPGHVANFLKLTESGFYNGTIFHRVIPDFMIQGGDPYTKQMDKSKYGTGGPGYAIPAEFSAEPHVRGTVSMARSRDPDSAGSQFFIVVKDTPHLNGQYTVFGRVISGMETVDRIVAEARDPMDNPIERVEMQVRMRAQEAPAAKTEE